VPRRRRQPEGLQRVLGANALFATVYGNVGSSIYYALGVTAVFALGLTPLVFLIAGVIFLMTTMTYAEGTVRFPEAGGSSSFARHAFNEVVSFGAAWAQMLNYVITISISAFFVPHYLSIFWNPLKTNPWDIIVGAAVIVALVILNIVGIQEAAKLNIGLAVIDFATQLLLVVLGFALIFSPHVLSANVHWGVAPTWSKLILAVPVAMIAYTGIETVSNLAEEARDPARNVPRAYAMTVVAVFAIYFTLPSIALTALPVHKVGDKFQTLLAQPPPNGFQNDPVLGLVEHLGITSHVLLTGLKVYVGILASTILLIATNAGVIGASRITYAMAHYRQLPQIFRRVHPRFNTPYIALIFFAGIVSIITLLPGKVSFLGTMYSFGAMLSFTIAHISITILRHRDPEVELVFRGRPNLRIGRVDWPLFAIIGGLATGLAWLSIIIETPDTRYVGLGWLALGFVMYAVYRRRVLHIPMSETQRAPAELLGPSLTVAYRTIVVPIKRTAES
jgi:basic amino acid/polyamine antiporter, APA family